MPFPQRVMRAYENYKYGPMNKESHDLEALIGMAMGHVAELGELVSGDDVKTAIVEGGGKSVVTATLVGQAWELYLVRRPAAPGSVSEATTWIMRLVPDPTERKKVFTGTLDYLIGLVG